MRLRLTRLQPFDVYSPTVEINRLESALAREKGLRLVQFIKLIDPEVIALTQELDTELEFPITHIVFVRVKYGSRKRQPVLYAIQARKIPEARSKKKTAKEKPTRKSARK